MQRQTTVTAILKSEQLLLFALHSTQCSALSTTVNSGALWQCRDTSDNPL